MITTKTHRFYAKRWTGKCPVPNAFPLPLYIDRHLSLPSLCEASHKDGWGEGFEQRPIDTPDGELYLSFWDAGNGFFIKPEEQLKNQQSQGFGMTMT